MVEEKCEVCGFSERRRKFEWLEVVRDKVIKYTPLVPSDVVSTYSALRMEKQGTNLLSGVDRDIYS